MLHRFPEAVVAVRLSKTALAGLMAAFALLVGINNLMDYESNFLFVQHVLRMDTTFEGNRLMWRAIEAPWLHHLFYGVIIITELSVGLCCAFGAQQMFRTRRADVDAFAGAKVWVTIGLTLGIALWFGGFMTIGAEWFLMWQSSDWNGQQAAFRFIACLFMTLIFLHQPEPAPREATDTRPDKTLP